ncbi:MAG TPA: urate hydroxylase PuuD [Thermoanaerobaculia bacterium]
MNYQVQEWLNLAFRWTHIFSAIMWVGATYYFTWLDRRFHTTDPEQVWMVHSGGFYVVNKEKMPSAGHTLHWFKWEAMITWLSGVLLLTVVYYMGGLMVDGSPGQLSKGWAIVAGIATMVVGWKIYDVLWLVVKNDLVGIMISYVLLVGLAYGLTQIMTSRAAFLHVGALLGTCMFANVWERILPAQRKMVAAARAGEMPDQRLADRAKTRSKHNTYIVVPTVFLMISNHAPVGTYGSQYNIVVFAVLVLVGWGVAHVIRKQ